MLITILPLLALLAVVILEQVTLFYILTDKFIPKWYGYIISVISTMIIILGLLYLKDYLFERNWPTFYEAICHLSYIIVVMVFVIMRRKR